RTFGDTHPSTLVYDIRILTFFRCHRINDSFDRFESIVVDFHIFQRFGSAWNHTHQIFHIAHLLDLLYLRTEVVEIELVLTYFLLQFGSLLFVKLLLSTFYQGYHVPHT